MECDRLANTDVHPDLMQQYQKYKILGVGLVICSILPCATLLIMYGTKSGLEHLGKHMLVVLVAFVLEIPLLFWLAYMLSLKRMRFLERSTQLVRGGTTEEVPLVGAYKIKAQDGKAACVLELIVGEDGNEIFPVIPNQGVSELVAALPDLPDAPVESKSKSSKSVRAFIDPETKRPVAVEMDGKTLWLSPPAKLVL